MSKLARVAHKLLIVGGIFNILSAGIHVVLPTIARWHELLASVPDDFVPVIGVKSKSYFFSQNYELVFICGGAGIMSLRYAKKITEGNRMLAWLSIWCGIVILYRAVVHFPFFGVSFQTILAFPLIVFLAAAYLFPLLILKELRA